MRKKECEKRGGGQNARVWGNAVLLQGVDGSDEVVE
jgi:hypothetical protein